MKRLGNILLLMGVLGTLTTHGQDVQANIDSQTPSLEAYQLNNHVKLEWAVEMLDEDVLYETGFEEGDVIPNLDYSNSHLYLAENRWYGGQEFTTADKHTGERSLKVVNSYKNSNVYSRLLDNSFGYSDYSWASFIDNRYYMPNGTDLSLSFKAKTTGNGTLGFQGTGGRGDYGRPLQETFQEDVKVGQRVVKVSDVSRFKNHVDSGKRFYLANMKGAYTAYLYVTSVDEDNSTITVNSGFKGTFNNGDKILEHVNRHPVQFPTRTFKSEQGWQLFNANAKVTDYADYNTLKRGIYLTIKTTTKDTVYIDDVKVGYATQTQLFKGNEKIYEGKLSDFEDTQATDKAKPNKVVDYSVSTASGKQYLNIVKPKDNGTSYKYTVKALSNDGSGEYTSQEKTVDVESGIKGYSYVIDTKATTSPNGVINLTTERIELPKEVYKKHYLHIQAIDNQGNKSDVSHIKLDKINDITPPTVTLTPSTTKWTNKNVIITVDAKDEHSGVKKITYIGENMVRNGDFKDGLEHWTEDKPNPTQLGSGDIAIRNGNLYLGDNRVRQNKALQENAFKDSPIGSEFYAVVDAKGVGVLNARYARGSGSPHQTEYQKTLNHTNDFKRYTFGITRFENSKDDFVIERRSQDGWLEISEVGVYAQKEITDNRLEVTENGTYKFVVEDNEGNITTESITISNIDKTTPTVDIKPSTTAMTNKDVTLTIDAKDSLSGVKSITYIGENMVKNGDFSEGDKYWSKQNYYGTWEVVDGVLSLSDNTVSVNKAYQADAFKGTTEGSSYFAEIEVRGTGELNARYGVSGGNRQVNHSKQIDNPNWETYTYIMERYSYSNDNFIIERVGTGSIDIKNINLYAQKEITDNKLEVTQNGTYTFVVEDNAGNLTTKSIKVSNIDKEQPKIEVKADKEPHKHTLTITSTKSSGVDLQTLTINGSSEGVVKTNGKSWSKELVIRRNETITIESTDRVGNKSKVTYNVTGVDTSFDFQVPNSFNFGDVQITDKVTQVEVPLKGTIIYKDFEYKETPITRRVDLTVSEIKDKVTGTIMPNKNLTMVWGVTKPVKVEDGVADSFLNYLSSTTNISLDRPITVIEPIKFYKSRIEFSTDNTKMKLLVDPTTIKTGVYEGELVWEVIQAP